MFDFDKNAESFEAFRELPAAVPAAIRFAIWAAIEAGPRRRLLDLGAGTGRIGRAFVADGDAYVGADSSHGMLLQFAARVQERHHPLPALVQADGRCLPFPDGSFDVILLAHVLTNLREWRPVLAEAHRVLRAPGALVLGQTVGPPNGIDAQLRTRLQMILGEMGADAQDGERRRDEARAWLEANTFRRAHVIAAQWNTTRTPRDFLARRRTSARFAALPPAMREAALKQLGAWTMATFGSLDVAFAEPYCFELDVLAFTPARCG